MLPFVNPFIFVKNQFALEGERWLLWAPVGVGAGIATYFALPFEPPAWALAATPILLFATIFLRRYWSFFLIGIALLTLALGFNAAQLETHFSMAPMLDRQIGPAPLSGQLMITEVMPDGVRLTLQHPALRYLSPEQTPKQIRLRIKNLDLPDVPAPGSYIALFGQVGPLSEPVMPGAYDFRRQSFFYQLGGTGWAIPRIDVVDPHPPTTWWDDAFLLFENARRALTLHVYNRLKGDDAAMTAALLNGQQNGIAKDVMLAMRVSGLSHLLSISGLHVSMMGLLVYFPLRAFFALIPWIALRFPIKKYAAFTAIIATMLYTVLVGPQAPTLRSALSTGILMFAIIVDRRAVSMRLVTLAASLVMLMKPDGVMGPSFQMSFAAVVCMVAAFEKKLDQALAQASQFSLPFWLHYTARHAGAIILTSLVATAATAPFTIYHFQNFSFYGFIANMLAIPLTSFWIMPNILLAYITAPLGLDGVFIDGAGWGVHQVIALANVIAGWPFAVLYAPAMPPIALILIGLGGLWLCIWRRGWRFLGLLPIMMGVCYPFYTPLPDVIIAADGKQWAARMEDGRLAVSNLDRDAFEVTQWQQRLAMPSLVDVFELTPRDRRLRCDDAGCVYAKEGEKVAFPILDAALLEDCEQAQIIVTSVDVKTCDAASLIDHNALWQHGAHALYFYQDAVTVTTNRSERGLRPWSPGWGYKAWAEAEKDLWKDDN